MSRSVSRRSPSSEAYRRSPPGTMSPRSPGPYAAYRSPPATRPPGPYDSYRSPPGSMSCRSASPRTPGSYSRARLVEMSTPKDLTDRSMFHEVCALEDSHQPDLRASELYGMPTAHHVINVKNPLAKNFDTDNRSLVYSASVRGKKLQEVDGAEYARPMETVGFNKWRVPIGGFAEVDDDDGKDKRVDMELVASLDERYWRQKDKDRDVDKGYEKGSLLAFKIWQLGDMQFAKGAVSRVVGMSILKDLPPGLAKQAFTNGKVPVARLKVEIEEGGKKKYGVIYLDQIPPKKMAKGRNLSPEDNWFVELDRFFEDCQYCGQRFRNHAIEAHEAKCPERFGTCKHCHDKIDKTELDEHQNVLCPERPVTCDKCGANVKAKDLSHHKQALCPFRKIPCECCHNLFPAKDLRSHEAVCPKFPVVCKFCNKPHAREEADAHAAVCPDRPVDCNKCGKHLKARDLGEHQDKHCPYRPAQCHMCEEDMPHCKLEEHYPVCPKGPTTCKWCMKRMPLDKKIEHEPICPDRCQCQYCNKLMQRPNLDAHLRICPKAPANCAACGTSVPQDEMQAHLKVCPCRLGKCKYCGAKVRANEMSAHLPVCPGKPCQCELCGELVKKTELDDRSHYGTCPGWRIQCKLCEEKVPRGDMQHHLVELCPFRVIQCRFCGEERIPASEYQRHRNVVCEGPIQHCTYCGEAVREHRMGQHRFMECAKNQVPCKLCGQEYTAVDHSVHKARCPRRRSKCKFCGCRWLETAMKPHMEMHKKMHHAEQQLLAAKGIEGIRLAPTHKGNLEGFPVLAAADSAAHAGLKKGDHVVAVGAAPLERIDDLPKLLGNYPTGSMVELMVRTKGQGQAHAIELPVSGMDPKQAAKFESFLRRANEQLDERKAAEMFLRAIEQVKGSLKFSV